MEENKKLESIPIASDMLSDLKRKIKVQKAIIFLQWLALLLWSLRRKDGEQAPRQQKPAD